MALTFLQDPGSRLIGRFGIPFRGTWKTLPAHLLPPDALSESLNVSIQAGTLRARSGLKRFSNTELVGEVMGSTLYVSETNVKIPVAMTQEHFYVYLNDWEDRTGPVQFALAEGSRNRMTVLGSGSVFYLVIANGTDKLYIWQAGPVAEIHPTFGGLVEGMTDVITAFGRVVFLAPPYTVGWSETYDPSSWPALNTAVLMDTPDAAITLKNLGTYGFVIYKETSLITAFAQAGTSAAAFKFEAPRVAEGPCSTSAVVNADGVHFGLTPSGRIFRFDGSNHEFIGDGLWPFLRSDIDGTRRHLVHGCYNYHTHEVYFWYPRLSQPTTVQGMVIICLPYPSAGVTGYAYFLGESQISCTDSFGNLGHFFVTTDTLVFGESKAFVLTLEYAYDDTSEIPIIIQPGMIGYQQGSLTPGAIVKPSFAFYFRKDASRGTATVQAAVSGQLEGAFGELSGQETIDLTNVTPKEYVAFDNAGTYVGVRVTGNASSHIEYLGCDIYGRETG